MEMKDKQVNVKVNVKFPCTLVHKMKY